MRRRVAQGALEGRRGRDAAARLRLRRAGRQRLEALLRAPDPLAPLAPGRRARRRGLVEERPGLCEACRARERRHRSLVAVPVEARRCFKGAVRPQRLVRPPRAAAAPHGDGHGERVRLEYFAAEDVQSLGPPRRPAEASAAPRAVTRCQRGAVGPRRELHARRAPLELVQERQRAPPLAPLPAPHDRAREARPARVPGRLVGCGGAQTRMPVDAGVRRVHSCRTRGRHGRQEATQHGGDATRRSMELLHALASTAPSRDDDQDPVRKRPRGHATADSAALTLVRNGHSRFRELLGSAYPQSVAPVPDTCRRTCPSPMPFAARAPLAVWLARFTTVPV